MSWYLRVIAAHLTVSLYLCISQSIVSVRVEGPWRAACQLKKPLKGPTLRLGSCWEEFKRRVFSSSNFLPIPNTQILINAEAPLRFVFKVFSVLRRWRARYSVPPGCLGHTVVQNLTPDVASTINNASVLIIGWSGGFRTWGYLGSGPRCGFWPLGY